MPKASEGGGEGMSGTRLWGTAFR